MHCQLLFNVQVVEFSLSDRTPGHSQEAVWLRSGIPIGKKCKKYKLVALLYQ